MEEFDILLSRLEENLQELFEEFIESYTLKNSSGDIVENNQIDESDYTLQLRAYIELAHAYFEEYFETIAQKVCNKAVEIWETDGKVVDVLLYLVSYYLTHFDTETKDKTSSKKQSVRKLDLRIDNEEK